MRREIKARCSVHDVGKPGKVVEADCLRFDEGRKAIVAGGKRIKLAELKEAPTDSNGKISLVSPRLRVVMPSTSESRAFLASALSAYRENASGGVDVGKIGGVDAGVGGGLGAVRQGQGRYGDRYGMLTNASDSDHAFEPDRTRSIRAVFCTRSASSSSVASSQSHGKSVTKSRRSSSASASSSTAKGARAYNPFNTLNRVSRPSSAGSQSGTRGKRMTAAAAAAATATAATADGSPRAIHSKGAHNPDHRRGVAVGGNFPKSNGDECWESNGHRERGYSSVRQSQAYMGSGAVTRDDYCLQGKRRGEASGYDAGGGSVGDGGVGGLQDDEPLVASALRGMAQGEGGGQDGEDEEMSEIGGERLASTPPPHDQEFIPKNASNRGNAITHRYGGFSRRPWATASTSFPSRRPGVSSSRSWTTAGRASSSGLRLTKSYGRSWGGSTAHYFGHREPQLVLSRREGFRNMGNTCYINACLQGLLSLSGFIGDLQRKCWVLAMLKAPIATADGVAGSGSESTIQEGATDGGDAVSRLATLYNALLRLSLEAGGSHGLMDATPLKRAMERHSDRFAGNLQQDAHEFLSDLINVLHEETQPRLDTAVARLERSASAGRGNDASKNDVRQNLPSPPSPGVTGDVKSIRGSAAGKSEMERSKKVSETGEVDENAEMMVDLSSEDRGDDAGSVGKRKAKTAQRRCGSHSRSSVDCSPDVVDMVASGGETSREMTKGHRAEVIDVDGAVPGVEDARGGNVGGMSEGEMSAGKGECGTIGGAGVDGEGRYDPRGADGQVPKERLMPTTRHFHAEVEVTLTCTRCDYSRRRRELYRDFSLDVPDEPGKEPSGLNSLLNGFFRPAELNLRCERCNHDQVRAEHSIAQLPGALVLHLKRFKPVFSSSSTTEENRGGGESGGGNGSGSRDAAPQTPPLRSFPAGRDSPTAAKVGSTDTGDGVGQRRLPSRPRYPPSSSSSSLPPSFPLAHISSIAAKGGAGADLAANASGADRGGALTSLSGGEASLERGQGVEGTVRESGEEGVDGASSKNSSSRNVSGGRVGGGAGSASFGGMSYVKLRAPVSIPKQLDLERFCTVYTGNSPTDDLGERATSLEGLDLLSTSAADTIDGSGKPDPALGNSTGGDNIHHKSKVGSKSVEKIDDNRGMGVRRDSDGGSGTKRFSREISVDLSQREGWGVDAEEGDKKRARGSDGGKATKTMDDAANPFRFPSPVRVWDGDRITRAPLAPSAISSSSPWARGGRLLAGVLSDSTNSAGGKPENPGERRRRVVEAAKEKENAKTRDVGFDRWARTDTEPVQKKAKVGISHEEGGLGRDKSGADFDGDGDGGFAAAFKPYPHLRSPADVANTAANSTCDRTGNKKDDGVRKADARTGTIESGATGATTATFGKNDCFDKEGNIDYLRLLSSPGSAPNRRDGIRTSAVGPSRYGPGFRSGMPSCRGKDTEWARQRRRKMLETDEKEKQQLEAALSASAEEYCATGGVRPAQSSTKPTNREGQEEASRGALSSTPSARIGVGAGPGPPFPSTLKALDDAGGLKRVDGEPSRGTGTSGGGSSSSSNNSDEVWDCPRCTFHNELKREVCEICDAPRPEGACRGGSTESRSADKSRTSPGLDQRNDGGGSMSEGVPAGEGGVSRVLSSRTQEGLGEPGREEESTPKTAAATPTDGSLTGGSPRTPEVDTPPQPRVMRKEPLRARYELRGVLHHLGESAFAGHYVTDVRDTVEDKAQESTPSVLPPAGGKLTGNALEMLSEAKRDRVSGDGAGRMQVAGDEAGRRATSRAGQKVGSVWRRHNDSVVVPVSEAAALDGEARRTCYICFYSLVQ